MPVDSQPSSPLNLPNSPPSHSFHQQQAHERREEGEGREEEKKQEEDEDEGDAGVEQHKEDVNSSQPQREELKQKQHDAVVAAHDLDSSDVEDPDPYSPSEFLHVDLLAIRKEVQCPICLGIIKKTRTVMECLHRFCRVCIDKSMRMGNNECPACRTHCASRRSLRDDPRFDELIAALYPDIKRFEEEELAFYEEDETRNKKIQESITQVQVKQTEALGKKRSGNKDSPGPSAARSQRNYQHTQTKRRRRRRRNGSADYQESDDNIYVNDSDKHLSPNESHLETTQRKRKGRTNVGMSRSPSTATMSGGSLDNNVERCKEERGFSPGLTCSPEMLAWGKGGVRSTTRQGNTNGSMNRSDRRVRLAKLVNFLRNLEENDDECVALGMPLQKGSAQLMDVEDTSGHFDTMQPISFNSDKLSRVAESLQDKFHALDRRDEQLSGGLTSCIPNGEQLVPAYQQKEAI